MEKIIETLGKLEISHKDYNLDKKDNLDKLPTVKAVFGVFAIVSGEPINCRYVGETENLQKSIKRLFENSDCQGLREFIQGPWIKMLLYEVMLDSSEVERQKLAEEWTLKHNPKVGEVGEY